MKPNKYIVILIIAFLSQTVNSQSIKSKLVEGKTINLSTKLNDGIDKVYINNSLLVEERYPLPERPDGSIFIYNNSGELIWEKTLASISRVITNPDSEKLLIAILREGSEYEFNGRQRGIWDYEVYDSLGIKIKDLNGLNTQYTSLSKNGNYLYSKVQPISVINIDTNNEFNYSDKNSKIISLVNKDSLYQFEFKSSISIDSIGLKKIQSQFEDSTNSLKMKINELKTTIANSANENEVKLLRSEVERFEEFLKNLRIDFQKNRIDYFSDKVENLKLKIINLKDNSLTKLIDVGLSGNEIVWFDDKINFVQNYLINNERETLIALKVHISENEKYLERDFDKILVFDKGGNLIFESKQYKRIADFQFISENRLIVLTNNLNERNIILVDINNGDEVWKSERAPRIGNLGSISINNNEIFIQQMGRSYNRLEDFKTFSMSINNGSITSIELEPSNIFLSSGIKNDSRKAIINLSTNKIEIFNK